MEAHVSQHHATLITHKSLLGFRTRFATTLSPFPPMQAVLYSVGELRAAWMDSRTPPRDPWDYGSRLRVRESARQKVVLVRRDPRDQRSRVGVRKSLRLGVAVVERSPRDDRFRLGCGKSLWSGVYIPGTSESQNQHDRQGAWEVFFISMFFFYHGRLPDVPWTLLDAENTRLT